MILKWPIIHSSKSADFRIFSIRTDRKLSPRTNQEHDFYIIEAVNWVNVIPVTPDDKVVMIEQYRHGSNTVELEIPGGMMDPEDASPVATAVRELREETGYEGANAQVIGQIYPNPAIMNNLCFTVLVENCHLKHSTAFDQSEDLITRLVPLADVQGMVAAGQIRHSLVVVALYHFELWRKQVRG